MGGAKGAFVVVHAKAQRREKFAWSEFSREPRRGRLRDEAEQIVFLFQGVVTLPWAATSVPFVQ